MVAGTFGRKGGRRAVSPDDPSILAAKHMQKGSLPLRTLMVFLVLVRFIGPIAMAAEGWRLVLDYDNGLFHIQNVTEPCLRHEILIEGTGPHYIGSHQVEDRELVILLYYGGSAGSSEIVRFYRAVIFNAKTRQFLGDFSYRFESSGIWDPETNTIAPRPSAYTGPVFPLQEPELEAFLKRTVVGD